jgi:hypothetical protein
LVGAPRADATEVWAKLALSADDVARVHRFFTEEVGVKPNRLVERMHVTVYHSRRPMPSVRPLSESARVVLPAVETRFMVMAPGGENPRPELDPALLGVGIRVHRQSAALPEILEYRRRLLVCENRRVLGSRAPSTDKASAFGARAFQAHMSILRPGSHVDRDLTAIGKRFRESMGDLVFDGFAVDVVRTIGAPQRGRPA